MGNAVTPLLLFRSNSALASPALGDQEVAKGAEAILQGTLGGQKRPRAGGDSVLCQAHHFPLGVTSQWVAGPS